MTTLIHEFYPSKARKEADKRAAERAKTTAPVVSTGNNTEIYTIKALKMGVTVHEYLRRRGIVQAESNKTFFQTGDTVYPSIYKEFVKYGKCIVVGVCRNIDDYGTVEWHEPPFILSVRPIGQANVINCTVGWVQKSEPECPNEC